MGCKPKFGILQVYVHKCFHNFAQNSLSGKILAFWWVSIIYVPHENVVSIDGLLILLLHWFWLESSYVKLYVGTAGSKMIDRLRANTYKIKKRLRPSFLFRVNWGIQPARYQAMLRNPATNQCTSLASSNHHINHHLTNPSPFSMTAAMDPGIPRINAEVLRKACVENRGFELPELNEVLILHYRGFRKIENLDDVWKKLMKLR